MIKLNLIIAFLFVLGTASAQTVNGIPVDELDVEYLQIVGQGKFMSSKITIKIDMGQDVKYFNQARSKALLDENNKPVILNSMTDALNFMSKCGYEYIDAFVVTVGSGNYAQNVYHYNLRRKTQK